MAGPDQAGAQAAQQRWPALALGGCIGLAWFAVHGGLSVVPTGRLEWLLANDPATHLNGWLHFRLAEWSWPLGRAPGFAYPLGASVATTDSIPWLATIGKLLSPALPVDFQYFGLYLAAAFILQGVMGARLTSLASDRLGHQVLGAAFFVTSPVLIGRLGHTALVGQWPLLLALDANLRPQRDARQAARTAALLGGAQLFASGVHPYLACMLLPLHWSFLWICARDRVVSRRWAAAAGGAIAAVMAGTFALFGYLWGPEPTGAGGFGSFSADLLSLVNPAGHSRWIPALPEQELQVFEGLGYLGLGVLLLIAALGGALLARRRLPAQWRRVVPLAVAALGWFLYALSCRITVAGRTVLDLSSLYDPLSAATDALRSSGRFVWPLHYAVMAAAVLGWLRWQRGRPAVAAGGLALALAVQVAETWTHRTITQTMTESPFPPILPVAAAWKELAGYRHLALVPARLGYQGGGARYLQERMGYVAYRLGATYNSGLTARMREDWNEAARQAVQAEVESGSLRPDTAYVFYPQVPARQGWRCRQVEGYQVCTSDTGPAATPGH